MLGATLVAIFFVPMFYMLVMRFEDWFDRKRGKSAGDTNANQPASDDTGH